MSRFQQRRMAGGATSHYVPGGNGAGPPTPIAFGKTREYKLSIGVLTANAVLATVSFGLQVVTGEMQGDSSMFQWTLIAALVLSPLYAVFSERTKVMPHSSEIICATYSAAAAFVLALLASTGWPTFWLVPPVMLSALSIGASALTLREYIRQLQDGQFDLVTRTLYEIRDELARRRTRRWWRSR